MRKLIYVAVIHMAADLGTIAKAVNKRGLANFGEDIWVKHKEAVNGFWDSLTEYFNSLKVEDFKIYQDGLIADGEIGIKIVEEGVKAGSKNYEIVQDLMRRGAVLVKTEDFSMVKKERDFVVEIARAKKASEKIRAYLKYKAIKNKLLRERDEFIASTINRTLGEAETGILFVGASHEIIPKLKGDIQVHQVKDAKQVKDYQGNLLRWRRNRKKLGELARYLMSPIS